jgi:hypothetical protein
MNIINVDSSYDLNPEIVEYVHSIARAYDQFADKGPFCPVSLTELMNRIPVLLVSEQSIKTVEGDIDLLGFYLHEGMILRKPVPVIGLCMDRIIAECRIDSSDDALTSSVSSEELDVEKFRLLTAKVLIHEFAHAIMALPPGADDASSTFPPKVYDPKPAATKPDYYKWMEEAMANLFTLECFAIAQRNQTGYRHYKPWGHLRHIEMPRMSKQDPLEFVEEFIRDHQGEGYLLGLLYFKLGIGKSWLWSRRKRQALSSSAESWISWRKNSTAQLDLVHKGAQLDLSAFDTSVLLSDYSYVLDISENEAKSSTFQQMMERRLHMAAARGDVHECKVILEAGENINIDCVDINGWTALHHAAYNGHADVCQLLLSGSTGQTANVNAQAEG